MNNLLERLEIAPMFSRLPRSEHEILRDIAPIKDYQKGEGLDNDNFNPTI